MTLDQIRIFLEVARQQHVTRAAATLNLTQSTVSAAIQALEERHGVRLFERIGRRIALTGEGKVFLPQAAAVLASAESAQRMLDDLSGTAMGSITILSSQTIATQWLPRRLVAFREAHPGIQLDLKLGNTEQCVAAVRDDSCDLAFIEATVSVAGLEQVVVGSDRLALVVGSRHPWCARPPQGLHDLTASKWVLREEGSGTRRTFEAMLEANGQSAASLDVFLELPSNEAICAAIADSALATVVSHMVAEPLILAGRLVELPLPVAERPFYMIRNAGRHRSRAVQALEQVITGLGD
jgi:DNA-binding transcriptional LysR family regulator